MKTYRSYIGDAWLADAGEALVDGAGTAQDIVDPSSSGEVVARVEHCNTFNIREALKAAKSARDAWGRMPAAERGALLLAAADALTSRVEEAAQAMGREQGKTTEEAVAEFGRALEALRWNGQHAARLCEAIPVDHERSRLPEPLGIVAAFAPWNYPAVLAARKIAAPLAAGCPVILKADERSPAAATAIVESLIEVSVPAGVVQLLFGDPPTISSTLLASPDVRVVTFTGSTRVGRELATIAARNLQQCVLELGGNSPAVVLADAEVESAARQIVDYKFDTGGQSCNAPNRIYVARSCRGAFVGALVRAVAALKVGPVSEPGNTVGPLIDAASVDRMERIVADACEKGAVVAQGGHPMDGPGHFFAPTVLLDVPPDALAVREETFGPILPVIAVESTDEAIMLANDTDQPLAAYVFGTDPDGILDVLRRLSAGSLSINRLGGVRADVSSPGLNASGYGPEGGEAGFRAFQNVKLVNGVGVRAFG